jgi:hypothetical protein
MPCALRVPSAVPSEMCPGRDRWSSSAPLPTPWQLAHATLPVSPTLPSPPFIPSSPTASAPE